ncbi:MAG: glycosyltransferase [Actinomycetia bacterium]|nr:glycosyltransferase [Actinomycetes bacterium]
MTEVGHGRAQHPLRGLAFAKQFPNDAEPSRGLFTVQQLRATRAETDWCVIAPVPWAPRWLAAALRRPYVAGAPAYEGIPVWRPRYAVLPRRLMYMSVAPSMAAASRGAFREVCAEHHPHFVHAHAIYPSAAAARRLIGGSGIPLVISVHGSDLRSNLARPSWVREVRHTLSCAAAVVCVSTALADEIRALDCVDPTKIGVIPNTYDDLRFTYVPREHHDGPFRLASIGNLVPVKGHDVLVRGVGEAVRSGMDITLDVVGGGPELGRLKAIAVEEGLAERVRFLGPLSDEEVASVLARADAFALASRSEGFGVAIVEALATGLPVLATRSGGPEDIVTEQDGVLVAPDDVSAVAQGLSRLFSAEAQWDRESIAARAHERYSQERIGEQLTAVYRSVVGAAASGGSGRG